MKLKFLRTVALALPHDSSGDYHLAGSVCDISDRHAAELYIAHGDAVAVEPEALTNPRSTLSPPTAPPAPAK